MKKIHVMIFVLLLALFLPASAQPPDSLWSRTFGANGIEICTEVQQTSDGGYILGGYKDGITGWDMLLVKADANGDCQWSRTFNCTLDDRCYSVQQTSEGGYILGGYLSRASGAGRREMWLVKTNANGDSLWSRTFGGPNEDDRCQSVQQTSDGGYILGGYSHSLDYGGTSNIYLVKTDANGDIQWGNLYVDILNSICFSVRQTTDGGYVLGGSTTRFVAGVPELLDMYLVKTDANGNRLWARTFGGSGTDRCYSVQQTSDGGYILGGYTDSFGAGGNDMWLVKTGPDPTIPRPAPQALVIAVVDGEASLNWQPSEDATLYHVYGSDTPGDSGALITTVTSTTWTDPDFGARPTPYFYSVTAE